MNATNFCIVTTLLTLIFTISSCGTPPTTSQLHLLGDSTQRIPITEAPAGLVRMFIYAIPSHQDSPPSTTKEEATADTFRMSQYGCHGTYITKGAVLTAKHCLNLDNETIVMIKLRFFSGHILYLKPPRPASASTFTSILHPAADLALLIFDAQTLQPPPHTVQLALHSDNERPPLYTEGVIYGSGGTAHYHPDYPDDLLPDTSQIRVARGLNIINPQHPKGLDYLCRIDLPFFIETAFNDVVYNYSCNRRGGWRLIRNIWRHYILHSIPIPRNEGPMLVITAHLRKADMSSIKQKPREILFCGGDSGSGVLDSSGKLIGVIVGIHPTHKKYVSQDEAGFPFDPIATTKAKCRHIAMAADLHKHKNWIETTLRSAL